MQQSRVALVRGDDRYDNIMRALEALGDRVQLADKRRIVVKPNFVSIHRQLAATHGDAVRAVLDFLISRGVERVTLAEGPATGSFRAGLEAYGYLEWLSAYPVDLVDLNDDQSVPVQLHSRSLRPKTFRVSRTVLESDYRISVSPPKTHNAVVVTLSLKNYAVGSLVRGQRWGIHQGPRAINLSLAKLARQVAPHLSVLDGFCAMEGQGPTGGDPVDWRLAIASADFLAADGLAAHLMGFDLDTVGYLRYCQEQGLGHGRLDEMEIVGNVSVEEARHPFRPHRSVRRQYKWQVNDAERHLSASS